MITCQFCGISDTMHSSIFQLDEQKRGFWCEDCDGYTYLDKIRDNHRFTLILEDKRTEKTIRPSPAIKLAKRLSPYRYPGGKTKIINFLYQYLQQKQSKTLVSPYTGGGSFELALLDAGVIERLHLNDLDKGVYALWWLIKNEPNLIIERLEKITPNHDDFFKARSLIQSDYQGVNRIEAAWASILVNRLAYSGIVKANPLGGKNGSQKQLLSRWNANNLITRIRKIHSLADRITISNMRATDLIEESYWLKNATIFVDPPYVNKGKDLYHCYYVEKDHISLATLLDSLHHGVPGADIILTYDYNEWLNQLYMHPEKEVIGRTYSV